MDESTTDKESGSSFVCNIGTVHGLLKHTDLDHIRDLLEGESVLVVQHWKCGRFLFRIRVIITLLVQRLKLVMLKAVVLVEPHRR